MLPQELVALLRHLDWASSFSARTLARGLKYAENGQVEQIGCRLIDGDTWELLASVSGSRAEPYRCMIGLYHQRGGLLVDGWCDCPVGNRCKHMTATLLTIEGSHGTDGTGASADLGDWEHWLQCLDQPATKLPRATAGQRFGLLLDATADRPLPALVVSPAWLRPSRRANSQAMVAPEAVELIAGHGPVPLPAQGWDPATLAALVALDSAERAMIKGKPWLQIAAAHEEQALEELLQRHPVWWRSGSRPLERGDPLPLVWRWHEADDGSQRLQAAIAVDDAILMQGAGLWYVHVKSRRYGRVEGDMGLVERITQAPELLPEQVARLRERLGGVGRLRALPAPIDRGPIQHVDVPPRAVLRLRAASLKPWAGAAIGVGVARLHFLYQDIPLPAGGGRRVIERVLHDERIWQVQRHLEAEQAVVRRLRQMHVYHANQVYGIDTGKLHRDDMLLVPAGRGQPRPPEAWQDTIEKLQEAGFAIEYEDSFPHDQLVEVDAWHGELVPAGNAWFEVSLGIEVGGERVDMLPILRRVLADPSFPRQPAKGEKKNACWRVPLDAERSIELPLRRLRAMIAPLLEWLEGEADGEPRVHRSRAAEFDDVALPWHGGAALRAQLKKLEDARKPARTPRGFKAKLRPYQRDGLAWLNFLALAGMGGILADDMGLGKTVQVLAHILAEKQAGRLPHPAVVIAPTSLVGNWAAEAARFAPALKVLVIHGTGRARHFADIAAHDLIISTYPLLPRDRERWLEARLSLLILDEAQAVKNAASQAAGVVRDIPATRRLAMTGTPLENHLGELWAQFDAVEPGLLGTKRQFNQRFRTPIEKHGDAERQARLNRRIGALMLRRRKDDVLTDLPPKNEIVRTLELAGSQRQLYESLRLSQHERVRKAVAERGLAQSGIIVLDALLKLRQACCDPRLVKLDSARKVRASAKLEALLELLDGLLEEGRRILLFSQFTEMLSLIEKALKKRKIAFQTLTGQTPGRQRSALVKRFQDGKVPLFLISLKAGGVGLNLTAADTVIHYDPWWNPAVEAQATDRAHRIGQDKPVFVYRLICADTVEAKIQKLQQRKADLARAVLEGGASRKLRFDEADLAELFGA